MFSAYLEMLFLFKLYVLYILISKICFPFLGIFPFCSIFFFPFISVNDFLHIHFLISIFISMFLIPIFLCLPFWRKRYLTSNFHFLIIFELLVLLVVFKKLSLELISNLKAEVSTKDHSEKGIFSCLQGSGCFVISQLPSDLVSLMHGRQGNLLYSVYR